MDDEMRDMIECRMNACRNHPEKKQIFYLEKMLLEAGYPYFFNFWEDLRPVFGGEEDGDPESIDWDHYNFLIELGNPAGFAISMISVCFNQKGDRELLELLDMRAAGDKENPTAEDGELHVDMTAEGCMEIIEEFFDSLPPIEEPDPADDWWDDEDDDAMPESMKEVIQSISGINPDDVDREVEKQKRIREKQRK